MAHRTQALRQPAFWLALATLVINDHLLKGAGVLPGWLTGKLSDFAGLIVAPVLVVVLLGLRRDGARALAFGAVALVFSILEVSPLAAAGWDAMLGALGVPSRSWADPTDLVALAVLPIAWWVVKAGDRAEPGRGIVLASQRALMGAALFACIATSQPPEPQVAQWTTDAWLHNRTAAELDVRIRWIEGARDCSALATSGTDLGGAAAPELFGEGITFRLQPGDTVPIEPVDARAALSTSSAFGRVPTEGGETRNECELASISVDGLEDTILFWLAGDVRGVQANLVSPEDGSIDDQEVVIDELTEGSSALQLLTGAGYTTARLRDRPPAVPATCTEARGATVAFSDLAHDDSRIWVVESRALLPDGCTQLDLIGEGEPRSLFLCVPGDFIPFVVDDEVVFETRLSGLSHVFMANDEGLPKLVLARGVPSITLEGLQVAPLAHDLGCAERVPCGAYVAPLAVTDVMEGGRLELDAAFARTLSGGRSYRAIITRAEHVVVASASCDAGRDRAGALIDGVVLFERTPEMVAEEEVP